MEHSFLTRLRYVVEDKHSSQPLLGQGSSVNEQVRKIEARYVFKIGKLQYLRVVFSYSFSASAKQ